MDHDLFVAATTGNVNSIQNMADRVNQVSIGNHTILHLASQSGKTECVQFILERFPSLLAQVNSKNETALHLAASKGNTEVVIKLLAAARGPSGPSNVPGTSTSTDPPSYGEDFIRHVNTDFDTALHQAVRNNHLGVVKVLVEADPADTHAQNSDLQTPVYAAAIGGYKDIINIIFEICIYATFDGPDGKTALHAAIERRDRGCVEVILAKRKHMVSLADNSGWTGLHYAAYHNVGSLILQTLLKTEKSIADEENIRLRKGTSMANEDVAERPLMTTEKTSLHIAASKGHIYILIKLMKTFPDLCEAVDEEGRNILHIAVEKSHKEMVTCILQECPVVNNLLKTKDIFGYTPLHLLVIHGCFIPELIKHEGVDKTAKDNEDFTPLDVLYLDEEIVAEQLKIKKAFEDNQRNQRPNLWLRSSNRRSNSPESLVEPSKRRSKDSKFKIANAQLTKEEVEMYRARTNTQIIVAALITTVTFTVGFTMPGGYSNNEGHDQGSAILSDKTAFHVFLIADAIALFLSTSSLFLYFISSLYQDTEQVSKLIAAATGLNIVSVVAMMMTFAAGTCVVLPHSSALAITVSVIACIFFLLVIFLLIHLRYSPKEKIKV